MELRAGSQSLETDRFAYCAWVLGAASLLTVGGCSSQSVPMPRTSSDASAVAPAAPQIELRGIDFTDEASARGLTFVWPQQPHPMRTNEAFGCGCAVFDFDNDGWQDVLLVADPHPFLFRNHGGQFADVTEASGLKAAAESDWIGCAIGDYDGDGWLDVLLTGFHQLALFRNVTGERFVDVTEAAGLDPANHEQWGSSAGFMDLDGDQWLDLVILNYVVFGPQVKQYCEMAPGILSGCAPKEYERERGELWRNNGQGGFELVPHEQCMQTTTGVGLVLAFADLDQDRHIDFYIGNDAVEADLMHNLGGMKFENLGVLSGLSVNQTLAPLAAMGADWGDYDRDGRLDLTVSNFQNLSFALFRNNGDILFTDASDKTGISKATRDRLGFGLNWLDFDNDGWLDMAYVNGHVHDNLHRVDPTFQYRQSCMLMRNEAAKTFVDLVPALSPDVARPLVGRGSATLDFDNDGRMDCLVVDYEGPAMLLHNGTRNRNHWIMLDLRGAFPNRFAYGAWAVAKAGEQLWLGQVSPTSSYLSSEDPRMHWGLGPIDRLESLTIHWPSGTVQSLNDVPVDRILRIDELPVESVP